ncbi:MAG TPA: hypothetical protein VJR05_03175 [Acidimicrobiia bacterium]|nr:hypothetical protein [Acidimicrobiia bacterium]
MYEAVEFVEPRLPAGAPISERLIGRYAVEAEAVDAARKAREAFRQSEDYAWWIVREEGAQLARWIADNRSHKEFALDLRTGTLVEIPLI